MYLEDLRDELEDDKKRREEEKKRAEELSDERRLYEQLEKEVRMYEEYERKRKLTNKEIKWEEQYKKEREKNRLIDMVTRDKDALKNLRSRDYVDIEELHIFDEDYYDKMKERVAEYHEIALAAVESHPEAFQHIKHALWDEFNNEQRNKIVASAIYGGYAPALGKFPDSYDYTDYEKFAKKIVEDNPANLQYVSKYAPCYEEVAELANNIIKKQEEEKKQIEDNAKRKEKKNILTSLKQAITKEKDIKSKRSR